MDPLAHTQIGLDGNRHPIGDPALHVHPNRPDAKPPLVVDPAADTGQPLGPGEMADPRVSSTEIADVASGLPVPVGVDAVEPDSAPADQAQHGRYDPRLYPPASTAAEAQLIADAKAEDPDAYPVPAGLEPDVEVPADEDGEGDDAELAAADQEAQQAAAEAQAQADLEQLRTAIDSEVEAAVDERNAEIAALREQLADAEAKLEEQATQEPATEPEPETEVTEPPADPAGSEPAPGPDVDALKSHADLDGAASALDPAYEYPADAKTVADKKTALKAELERRAGANPA